MLRNNCEHVAQFCKTGVWRSAQAEAVLHKVSAILGKVKRALPVHVPIVGPPLMEIAEVGRDAVSNFLGSLAVASNAPPLNLQCSFESIAPTGRAEDKRIVLMSYWCRTCWGPDSGALGCVCPVCALRSVDCQSFSHQSYFSPFSCHDGHDIQLQPIMSYVCSCGQCAHRNLCTNVLLDAGCIPPRFVPSIPGAQTSLVPSHSLAPVSPSIPPIVATADSPATSVGTPPAATSFNAAPGVQRLYQCEACNAVLCFPCSRTCHAMHRMTDLGLVALDCSGSSSTPPLRCQCAEATATSGTRCRLARVNIDPPPPFAANILCSCGDVQTAAASAKASLTTDSDAAAAFAVAASTAAAVASQVMHGRSYTEPEVLCASGEDQETVHCDSAVPVGPNGQDLDGTGNLPLRGVSSLPN